MFPPSFLFFSYTEHQRHLTAKSSIELNTTTTPGLGHQSVSGETNISAFLHRCSNIYTSTWIQTVRSDGGTQFKHDSRKTNLQTCCLRSSNEDYVSRSVFARPSVQSRPSSLGFCPGGEGGGWHSSPCRVLVLCSHLRSVQSHINCSVNAIQQPIEAEILGVCQNVPFLIHYVDSTAVTVFASAPLASH